MESQKESLSPNRELSPSEEASARLLSDVVLFAADPKNHTHLPKIEDGFGGHNPLLLRQKHGAGDITFLRKQEEERGIVSELQVSTANDVTRVLFSSRADMQKIQDDPLSIGRDLLKRGIEPSAVILPLLYGLSQQATNPEALQPLLEKAVDLGITSRGKITSQENSDYYGLIPIRDKNGVARIIQVISHDDDISTEDMHLLRKVLPEGLLLFPGNESVTLQMTLEHYLPNFEQKLLSLGDKGIVIQPDKTPILIESIKAYKETRKFKSPEEWREYVASEQTDLQIFRDNQQLRENLDPIEGWRKTKELAKVELATLPPDILQKLIERFKPFMEKLPAGHGRGHLSRDLINLAALLNDPELPQDSVELVAGSIAGMYHDIGNSIVGRYDDPIHFAGHAEVGAYLFGEVAQDIIPPNLLQLIKYSIAAHTHYTKDISVTRNGHTQVRKSYVGADTPDGTDKTAIWLARKTDRMDLLQDPIIFIRHVLTKVVPTEDYDGEGFHVINPDELEDFIHQFTPVFRSPEERSVETDPKKKTPNILEHIMNLSNSAFAKNVYTSTDTNYFREALVHPAHDSLEQFIKLVTTPIPPVEAMTEQSQRETRQAFENFYNMCRFIEPAPDTEMAIDLFRQKFEKLGEQNPTALVQWGKGFTQLSKMLQQWYDRMDTATAQFPHVPIGIAQILVIDVQGRGRNILHQGFDPILLQEDQFPNLIEILGKSESVT